MATKKKAKTRIPRKIRKIQASRSKRARTLDALRTAKQVLSLSEYEQWAKNPGRYDLVGVDTANVGKRKTHRKKPLWEVILTKRTIMEMPGECYGVPEQKRVRGRGNVPSDVVKSKCTEQERECMKIHSYKKLGAKENKKKLSVKKDTTKKKAKTTKRIKKGDIIKIYRSGLWCANATVTSVKDGIVTARYKDIDGRWITVKRAERNVELAPAKEIKKLEGVNKMPRIGNWRRITEYRWYNDKRKWTMKLLFIWRSQWFASCEDEWHNVIWDSRIGTQADAKKAAIRWMRKHP